MVTTYVNNNSGGGGSGTPTNITAGDGIVVSGSDPNYTIAVDPTISDLVPFTSSDASIDIVATNPGFDFRVAGGTGSTGPIFQSVDNSIIIATDPSGTIVNFSQNPSFATTVESSDIRIQANNIGNNAFRLNFELTGLIAYLSSEILSLTGDSTTNLLSVYEDIVPDDTGLSAQMWEPLSDGAAQNNLRIRYISSEVQSRRRVKLSFGARAILVPSGSQNPIQTDVPFKYGIMESADDGITFQQVRSQVGSAVLSDDMFANHYLEISVRFQAGTQIYPFMFADDPTHVGKQIEIASVNFIVD